MTNDLAARRRELLRKRLEDRGLTHGGSDDAAGGRSGRPASVRADRARTRLPIAAHRLWFVGHRDPDDTSLNVSVAFALRGALDVERLRGALGAVVARHETLRARYLPDAAGEPQMEHRASAEIDWAETDLSELSESAAERRLQVLAAREARTPFRLAEDAPLRVRLVTRAVDDRVLLLTVHHIAWDDESWAVFFHDLAAAYRGRPLPALAVQYADLLDPTDDHLAADLAHWTAVLRPAPEPLDLPAADSAAGSGRLHRSLLAQTEDAGELIDIAEAAADLARRRGTTVFAVLIAATQAFLHRIYGAHDVTLAVPTAVRPAGADDLIGYFGNTVLLRGAVTATASTEQLADAAHDALTAALAASRVPVDRVVAEVADDRRAGLAGLAAASLTLRRELTGPDLEDVAATHLDHLHAPNAQLPLEFAVVTGDAPILELQYRTERFAEPEARALLSAYATFLADALTHPDAPIRDARLLDGPGRRAAIAAASGPTVDEAPDTLVAMFAAAVAERPSHPALVTDEGTVTYADLDAAADHLARRIVEDAGRATLTADSVVALRMSAGEDFVVAALAVLKAGAAYLPVDPDYPADRAALLLGDARPVLVLDAADVARLRAEPVAGAQLPVPAPASLAYLIYTSGSTGVPKGVAVEHRAIAEHLRAFAATGVVGRDDRLVQTSSVSFDASVFEIFATLTAGATLVIPRRGALTDIAYLADLLVRANVTVMHMVPSMLSTLLLIPEVKQWTTLRTVPVGGEALPGEVADAFTTAFTADLSNNYGPTEAVVAATHHRVDGPRGGAVVPIGRPNPGVTAHLLGPDLQPVPDGVVGEVYLGGRQLARGYLRRSGPTAARFIADPFGSGARLYRTGDLARRGGDGQLHFVGRSDDQLKVRGFRIEPGEIEAALNSRADVQRALVAVIDDRLLAYVIVEVGADPDPVAVREDLAGRLPDHLVPDAVVVIDEVPLTVHGKLDRTALPVPALAAPDFVPPATPTQRRVAAVFAELFGGRTIGADDSFFDLGGHSLLAARLVTALSAEFGLAVDVRAPFDAPTVAGLAAHLVERAGAELGIDLDADTESPVGADWADADWAGSDWASADFGGVAMGAPATVPAPAVAPAAAARPPLVADGPGDRVPLSFSQLAMWFNQRIAGARADDNIVLTFAIDGPVDAAALGGAVDDVVARHRSLRTTFTEIDGLPVQLVNAAVDVQFAVVDAAEEAEAARLLDEAADVLFDLAHAPLVRARLVRAPATSKLVLVMHHMVVDHGSVAPIVADLAAAYRARTGAAVRPADRPLDTAPRYTDLARWQHAVFGLNADPDSAAGRYGRAQLDHWRERLAGLPDEILVAADRPRPEGLGRRGTAVDFHLPAERVSQLKAVIRAAGVTDFMAVTAMWSAALHTLGGGTDIAVGTPAAGRVDPGTDGLVGLLANMVVLRTDVSGQPTLAELLRRTRDTVLDAFAHQEVPIERLVEALNPRRTRARNPLFQSMIHFRDAASESPVMLADDTSMRLLPMTIDTSYLDLNLIVTSRDDGGLSGRLIACADLYDEDAARGIAARFTRLLDALADDPDRTPADVALRPMPGAVDASAHAEDPARLAELIAAGSPRRVQAKPATLAGLPHAGLTHCASVATWIVDGPGAAGALTETLRALSPGSLVIDNHAAAPSSPVAEVFTVGGGAHTATERALIVMLEELLGVTGIGRDDNFFAVGGDSVISIQWSARAAASGIALDPQQIFDHYTIGELAAAVDAARDDGPDDAAPADAAPSDAAPMSASGLSADLLSALGSAWEAQQ